MAFIGHDDSGRGRRTITLGRLSWRFGTRAAVATGLLATGLAIMGIGQASAHTATLGGTLVCSPAGEHVITWSLYNDYSTTMTPTVVAGVVAASFPSVPARSTVTTTTSLPGSQTGNYTLTIEALWPSDGYLQRPNPSTTVSLGAACVVPKPDLKIVKTADASPVNTGDPVGFKVVVSNQGNAAALSVKVSDPLPTLNGMSWSVDTNPGGCAIAASSLSCSLGDLAAGASATVHVISATISATPSGTLDNTASASATGVPSVTSNAKIVINAPSLSIRKTADAPHVSSGDPVGFTIAVANAGPGTARGVAVQDPLPGLSGVSWSLDTNPGGVCTITTAGNGSQSLACGLGDLAAGASVTAHVSASTTTATSGTLDNTASVSSTNTPGGSSNAKIVVEPAALSVRKTADASPVSSGDPVGFTMVVANGGPGTARGVVAHDPLPALTGVSWSIDTNPGGCAIAAGVLNCSFGDMGPGGSKSIHITSATTNGTAGTLDNTVAATAANTPTTTSEAKIVVNAPGLGVAKSADASPVSSGDTIGFKIVVSNSGAGTAKSVQVSDVMPTLAGVAWAIQTNPGGACSLTGHTLHCNLGDMASGGSVTIHLTSATTTATAGTLPNTVEVAATNSPGATANASIVVDAASLTVTKTADASPVSAGDTVGFKVVVANAGLGTARRVSVTDLLPALAGVTWTLDTNPGGCTITAGTLACSLGDLAGGASVTAHLSGTTTAATSGTLDNTASVSSTNAPGGSSNAKIVVEPAALSVDKTADATPVLTGDTIGFKVVVSNAGPGTAHAVTVSDPLPSPAGVSWSIDTNPGGCSITTATLTCSLGDVASGTSATIHITSATSDASVGTLDNTASAEARNTGSATSEAKIVVDPRPTPPCTACPTPKPALATTKIGPAAVAPGARVAYIVSITNTGDAAASSVVLTDPVPANTTFLSESQISGPGFACTNPAVGATGATSCTVPSLAPGASAVFAIADRAAAGLADSALLTNTVTGIANSVPPVSSTVVTKVMTGAPGTPELSIAKTAPPTVTSGDPITYSVSVTNAGTAPAADTVVTDLTPPNTTFVAESQASGPAFTCTNPVVGQAGVTSCGIASLAEGETAVFTIVDGVGAGVANDTVVTNTASVLATGLTPTPATARTTVKAPTVVKGLQLTNPPKALAFTGANPRRLLTWAAMLLGFGAIGLLLGYCPVLIRRRDGGN